MEPNFPILGSNPKEYISLSIVKPHEKQAIINHSQTLERLASRGGLSWVEMLFVLKDKPFNCKAQLSEMDAKTEVLKIVDLQSNVKTRIVQSKCMADMLVWLGFEYKNTDIGYSFERSPKFDSAWRDIHSLRQCYRK